MKSMPVALHSFPLWLPQTQTWMYTQVAELQKLGANVHVVCERTDNLDQFRVQNIHCLADEPYIRQKWDRAMRRLGVRNHLGYLVKVGRRADAQIIHSHFGNIAWQNLGAARKLRVKHVVTFYGYDASMLPAQFPIWRKRYLDLFEQGDLFLCEGSHMAQSLIKLGCPEHKLKVQHLGVDIERFEYKPRKWSPGEPLKVLIAASFREKKGIPYAIEALRLLSNGIQIELTIIGDAGADESSQIEKNKIIGALNRSGLRDRTRLFGYQPHSVMMNEAYAHHIFLQPSVTAMDGDTEGGAPVSIIEMMATGMPVVATTHCDIPEVVGESLHNLLAPERDHEALFQVLLRLLDGFERWPEITAIGRSRVAEEYNHEIQAMRLLEHYKQIMTGAQHQRLN
jgi:colanic acid/amylovoran/stewartan biosynthesis glycosyltransferase WcaL/AmsK/CpsK